jgi:hypothetical protein
MRQIAAVEFVNRLGCQKGNVSPTLSQGGNSDAGYVQTIEQIHPEAMRDNIIFQIAIGCCDDPDVYTLGTTAAEGVYLLRFKHPQQFGLRKQTHFANFVKKQRAAMSLCELAPHGVGGTCKRAAGMPEEFGFYQRVWNGTTVHDDKAASGTRAECMDGLRDSLFASASFARDQHCRARPRDFGQIVDKAPDRRAIADQSKIA